MTTLGKILVFANLAFSVVTAGLIIMVFAKRTDWKTAYDKLENNVKVAQANAKTYMDEVEEVKRRADFDKKKVDDALALTKKERDGFERETKTWVSKYQELEKLSRTGAVNVNSTTEELARRKGEIDQLKVLVDERDKKMLELEGDKKNLRDRMIAAELAFKSEQDRNSNLLVQLETMHRDATKTPTGKSVNDRYPPPEDVEGLVLEADPQTGYLTLSIGSDAGLRKGNTLEVFRLKPAPQYLGTVQILDVRPDRAVAKPLGNQRRGQILVGDRVGRDILTRR